MTSSNVYLRTISIFFKVPAIIYESTARSLFSAWVYSATLLLMLAFQETFYQAYYMLSGTTEKVVHCIMYQRYFQVLSRLFSGNQLQGPTCISYLLKMCFMMPWCCKEGFGGSKLKLLSRACQLDKLVSEYIRIIKCNQGHCIILLKNQFLIQSLRRKATSSHRQGAGGLLLFMALLSCCSPGPRLDFCCGDLWPRERLWAGAASGWSREASGSGMLASRNTVSGVSWPKPPLMARVCAAACSNSLPVECMGINLHK